MALTCIQKTEILALVSAFLNKAVDVTKTAEESSSKVFTDGQIVDSAIALASCVTMVLNREAQAPQSEQQKSIMDGYYDILLTGVDEETVHFIREVIKKYTYQPTVELKEEFLVEPRYQKSVVDPSKPLADLKCTDIVFGRFKGPLK